MTLEIIAALGGGLGLLMLVSGVRRLGRGHVWRGCRRCTGALLMLAVAGLAVMAAAHLYTYARLTQETEVAQVRFTAQGDQFYLADLSLRDGRRLQFELRGDEWQMDARILKWTPQANLLGFDTAYRLERISGRYRQVSEELERPRSVYSLAAERGLDLWQLAQDHPAWLPGVDAQYGSATFLPMRDGAHFEVSVSTSGLLARPADTATEAMLAEGW